MSISRRVRVTVDDIVITEPFRALGVGWSGIGDTQRTAIVYVFDSAEDAVATVEAIGSVFELDDAFASGAAVTVMGRAGSDAGPMGVLPGLAQPSPLSLHR